MIKEVYRILILFNVFVDGYCLQSYYMHGLCGSTINVTSGQLEFNNAKLPADVISCQVTLVTRSISNSTRHRLLFYFSNYFLPNECRYINITLFDVCAANSTKSISGVSDILCGGNLVLTNRDDCLFITEGSGMRISFTRSKQEKQHPANFTLIYSSFHTGTCDDPGGVGCSFRNSTKLKDACFDSKDICKRFNDVVCYVQHNPGKSSKIVQYLLCGLLGIAVLFALKFFYHQYKKGEEAEGEDVVCGTCQQNIKTRLTQMLHLQNVQTSERIDTTDLELSSSNPSIADINYYMNDNQGTHTDISSLEFGTGPPVRPSAPVLEQCDSLAPPYEETPVPSYSEVMSHQDKYIVH